METLKKVYQITIEINKLLEGQDTTIERQQMIEQISSLIEKRGEYLQFIQPPYTESEKTIGREIVQLNKKMEAKMNALFTELKQEMQQMKQQRKSTQSYINPYRDVQTMDGMFMDKKK